MGTKIRPRPRPLSFDLNSSTIQSLPCWLRCDEKRGARLPTAKGERSGGPQPVSCVVGFSVLVDAWTRSERTTARWMCRNPTQLCSRLCSSWHGAPPPSLYLRALIVVRKGTRNKNQHERSRRGQKTIEKEERSDAAEEGINARRVRHACLPSPHPPQEQPDATRVVAKHAMQARTPECTVPHAHMHTQGRKVGGAPTRWRTVTATEGVLPLQDN